MKIKAKHPQMKGNQANVFPEDSLQRMTKGSGKKWD